MLRQEPPSKSNAKDIPVGVPRIKTKNDAAPKHIMQGIHKIDVQQDNLAIDRDEKIARDNHQRGCLLNIEP